MAVAMLWETPGGSAELQDAVRAQLDLTDDKYRAAGCHARFAGTGPRGWRVIEVWESEEAQRAFFATHIQPALAERGVQRAEPEVWELHALMTK